MQRLVHQLHTDPHIALGGGERRRGEERRREEGGGKGEERRRRIGGKGRKEREEEEGNVLVSLASTIMVVMYEPDIIPPSLNTVMQLKYTTE